jgi:hypothetical protein
MIQVKVVSEDDSMIQRTLDAAAENNSVGKMFAKKDLLRRSVNHSEDTVPCCGTYCDI